MGDRNMPWYHRKTFYITMALFVAISVWDVFLALNDTPGDTISETFKWLALHKWSIFPYIVGILIGHLVFVSRDTAPAQTPKRRLMRWLIMPAIGIILQLWTSFSDDSMIRVLGSPEGAFIIGAIVGRSMWAQYAGGDENAG